MSFVLSVEAVDDELLAGVDEVGFGVGLDETGTVLEVAGISVVERVGGAAGVCGAHVDV